MKTQHNKTARFRRSVIQISLILAVIWLSGCVNTVGSSDADSRQVSNTNFSASEDFSFDLTIGSQDRFVLSGINGTVTLVGTTNNDQVLITGTRQVKSESTADAERWLQELNVLVNTFSNSIEVTTEQPNETYGRNFQVFYEVRVPQSWQVDIDNVNGIIRLDSLNARATVNSVNGDVWVTEHNGDLIVDLVNGQINSTVYLPIDGICDLETVNGLIFLSIPESTSAMVNASVVNGSINLSNLQLTQSTVTNRSVSGKLGNGEGTIRTTAVNGTINLTGFQATTVMTVGQSAGAELTIGDHNLNN